MRVGNRVYIGESIRIEDESDAIVWICSLDGEIIESFRTGTLVVVTDLQGKLINQHRLGEDFR